MKHRRFRFSLAESLILLFLFALSFLMVYPFWHTFCLSLSSATEATKGGLFVLPREFSTGAYRQVVKSAFVWTSLWNSVWVSFISAGLGVLLTAMLAYGLSKPDLRGRTFFSFFVLFSMIFSGGLIPTYLVVQALGLRDTLWSLILMGLVGPYNCIVMMSFFRNLPKEIEEAAEVDGCGTLRSFFVITLPLSKAILATIGLWIAVFSWNNFQGPLIYISSRPKFTLPLYIRQVIEGTLLARQTGEGARSALESVIGATIIFTIFPILLVYPFLQKYFVKGVMIGSVKG